MCLSANRFLSREKLLRTLRKVPGTESSKKLWIVASSSNKVPIMNVNPNQQSVTEELPHLLGHK